MVTPIESRSAEPATAGLSLPEIAYLLHLAPKDGQTLARDRLQLVAEPDDDVLRSGLSALAARNGVRIEGGVIRPAPENAAIAAVLATADHWVEVGMSAGGRSEVIHVVAGSGAVVVINRRPLGVLEFAGVRPDVPIEECVMQIVSLLVADDSLGRIVINSVGFGASICAIAGVRRGTSWRLIRWQGDGPMTAGVVTTLAFGGAPAPGWSAIGDGDRSDLLSWSALTVGAASPANGSS